MCFVQVPHVWCGIAACYMSCPALMSLDTKACRDLHLAIDYISMQIGNAGAVCEPF